MTNGGTCEYILDPDEPETWGGSDDSKCYVSSSELNDEGVWTCPHDAEEGENLCLFHLPVEQKKDHRVTSALLDTLNSFDEDEEDSPRRTQFIGARFGKLIIEGKPYDKHKLSSPQPIDLTHCRFQGDVSLIGLVFEAEIDFSGATFEEEFLTKNTRFHQKVRFYRGSFNGEVLFNDIWFSDRVYLKNITASAPVELRNSTLNGWFSFRNALFEETVKITDSEFGADSISGTFQGSTFEHEVTFRGGSITGSLGFEETTFQSGLKFLNMQAESEVSFVGAVIAGNLVCERTKFEETLDFRSPTHIAAPSEWPKTKVGGEGSFNSAEFSAEPKFVGTEFGEASFADASFDQGATFEEAQFNSDVSFSDIDSNGQFEFTGIIVDGSATFDDAYFSKAVDLSDTQFRSDVTFREAMFRRNNNLDRFNASNASFGGEVSFEEATLYQPASFNDIKVSETARFNEIRFYSGSDFSGSVFNDDIQFRNAVFGYTTDWSEAVVNGDADFSGVDWEATNRLSEPVRHTMAGMTIQGNANFSSLSRENDFVDFSEINISGEQIHNK